MGSYLVWNVSTGKMSVEIEPDFNPIAYLLFRNKDMELRKVKSKKASLCSICNMSISKKTEVYELWSILTESKTKFFWGMVAHLSCVDTDLEKEVIEAFGKKHHEVIFEHKTINQESEKLDSNYKPFIESNTIIYPCFRFDKKNEV